jgi:phosphatidylserine decarboxylase
VSPGPLAAPGYPFVGAFVVLFILGWLLGWGFLAILGGAGALFLAYFYRDPERPIPGEAGVIVSPADGKLVILDEVQEDQFLQSPARRLGIFMNVLDAHVNRSPVAGTVADMRYRSGQFKAAFRQEAGWANEQQAVVLESDKGPRVLVVQIAGLLARRIIPFVKPGQRLGRGERLGMICFGSRVDLYLPVNCESLVKVGDRLKAGSSIVGRWS